MSSAGRMKQSTGSSSSSSSKQTSVKKSGRPSSALSSTKPLHKLSPSSSSTTSPSSSSSSRPGSASSSSPSHHGRPSQLSTGKPSSSDNKAAATQQRIKHNGAATQALRRSQSATSRSSGKAYDVTIVREPLSSDEQVTDKPPSDVSASSSRSRDAESPEVLSSGSSSMIRRTAGAGRNNTQASVAGVRAGVTAALTSGASRSAASSREGEEAQFTADRAPWGASSSGPATSAVDAASSRGCETGSRAAGRRTIDDDSDDDTVAHAGLMCRRHDVIGKGHVTNDVTAMADKRRKSPDPFYVDDMRASAETTSEIPNDEDDDLHDALSLRRQNSVLTQLLSAKKVELDEARQRFKVCTSVLEDEVERLRQEKDRLFDRLQLPEDERCSLSVEEQSLHEMSRRLRQCDERNDELKNENVELRQDLRDAELAMHELHDQFQAEEGLELRELQRELDNTARDCRLLHFKVRLSVITNFH